MWLTTAYPRGVSKKDTKSMERYAIYENNRQWQDVFARNMNIVTNIFEWENLPITCDQYFMEQTLIWQAQTCVVDDTERGGMLSLPCVHASAQNLYQEHSYYRAVSLGYSKDFMALTKYNESIFSQLMVGNERSVLMRGVVCFDNLCKYPLHETVAIWTDKMVDAMRAIDVVTKQLKISSIIETDEESKLSIQKVVENIDNNLVAVYASKNVAQKFKETKSLLTGVTPSTLTELWNHLNNLKSEFLTAFGINNLNTGDKKERLLTDEINSNDEAIALNLAYRLDQRLHFCENYNAVFKPKKPLLCKIKHDFNEAQVSKGGKEKDGSVHNDNAGSSGNS